MGFDLLNNLLPKTVFLIFAILCIVMISALHGDDEKHRLFSARAYLTMIVCGIISAIIGWQVLSLNHIDTALLHAALILSMVVAFGLFAAVLRLTAKRIISDSAGALLIVTLGQVAFPLWLLVLMMISVLPEEFGTLLSSL